MYITELYNPEPSSYRQEKDDNTSHRIEDNRKRQSKITLKKLHNLRMMNDGRKLEHEEKLKSLSSQYKPQASAEAGGLSI
jgi:hypothetical protein